LFPSFYGGCGKALLKEPIMLLPLLLRPNLPRVLYANVQMVHLSLI
jgi:hypothetical protein